MRISDIMLNNGFINDTARTKEKINKLSSQITRGVKIQKPSDSPHGTSRILRLGTQSSQNTFYSKNIENSLAIGKETNLAMESIQEEVGNILTLLSDIDNPTAQNNYQSYSEKLDLAIGSILNYANSQSDGKYIFGGTDHSSAPYGYSSDLAAVASQTDSSGKQVVRLSANVTQKINMTGTEVFGTILQATGNLNKGDAAGASYSTSSTIYNASKEAFTVQFTYTKTAANTYSLSYDITDSTSTSIYSTPPDAVLLKFDPASGKIKTIGGKSASTLQIQDDAHHLDFNLDLNSVGENNSASSITASLNQKTDIFNTLIRIKNSLAGSQVPSDEDKEMVRQFNSKILANIATNGNITNQLSQTQDLLTNQKTVLTELLTNEQEIDSVQAITDLQNYNYSLEMAYKVSSSILPKSLLDYL